MLPEPLRLLIAAYAADDLSPRRKKAAVRLLKHSREARQLLRGIIADRKALRSLPRHRMPDDFADQVLGRLLDPASAAFTLVQRPALPRRNFAPAHVAAAFAAAIAVGLGVWMITLPPGDRPRGESPPVVASPKLDPVAVVKEPPSPASADERLEPRPPEAPPPPAPPVVAKREPESNPVTPPPDVLTAPATPKLETVRVRPPRLTLVLPSNGLDSPDSKAKLGRDLGLGEAHRIDLFARDTNRGFDRLQAALRDKGVRATVEAVAADAHKRKVRGQTYVVFCEELTASECVALFRHLAVMDRRAEERKSGDGAFETLALMAMSATDQKDLTGLLGADVSQAFAKPKATGSIDVRKPVSDGTAQHVADALEKAGQGRKPGDKAGIVLSASEQRAVPASSREIKQFLEGRRERAANCVAVMLVLRLANN